MRRSMLLAILLGAAGTGTALAHDCSCYSRGRNSPCLPRVARSSDAGAYRGYPPLRNASPQDPSGTIVLEGAAGAGAPNGD